MNPSPFQLAQGIGNQFGRAFQAQGDRSAIDEILSNAAASGKPQDIDAAMGQILSRVSPEKQPMALRILEGKKNQMQQEQQDQFKQFQQQQQQQLQQQQEQQKQLQQREAYEKAGFDPSLADLPQDLRKQKITEVSKGFEESEAKKGALDVVDRMRDLRKSGNLGVGSGLFGAIDPAVRRDKSEYEQLGKSLISFATNIPIRNRLEFETLAEKLFDSSITDASAEGILNAMERILSKGTEKKQKERVDIGEFEF